MRVARLSVISRQAGPIVSAKYPPSACQKYPEMFENIFSHRSVETTVIRSHARTCVLSYQRYRVIILLRDVAARDYLYGHQFTRFLHIINALTYAIILIAHRTRDSERSDFPRENSAREPQISLFDLLFSGDLGAIATDFNYAWI